VYGGGTGVTISNVIAGSPAEQAGLKVGDTITSVDGKEVKAGDELVAEIAGRKPGSKAKLGFLRNGKKEELSVTVADRVKIMYDVILVFLIIICALTDFKYRKTDTGYEKLDTKELFLVKWSRVK
jgi:PDZ domain-containing secreted protein